MHQQGNVKDSIELKIPFWGSLLQRLGGKGANESGEEKEKKSERKKNRTKAEGK